jgi:hypothetical protein
MAGGPIWPPPLVVGVPRLLGGVVKAIGYPLAMVLAEKIVTLGAPQAGAAARHR